MENSLESGLPLMSKEEAKKEVARLNKIYGDLAIKEGFKYTPDKEFIKEFTDRMGGPYFHQFSRPELPSPLEMFYSWEDKRFSLGMGFEVVPNNIKMNRRQAALTRLEGLTKWFSDFHHFIKSQGYDVQELTGSENLLDYDYHGIKASTIDDVNKLGEFLSTVRRHVMKSPFMKSSQN